jgi:hypothetical protein
MLEMGAGGYGVGHPDPELGKYRLGNGKPTSPYGPTLYRMQVTILTSKEDVKRTRVLGCLTGGRPESQRHSGEWRCWRSAEGCGAQGFFFEKDKDKEEDEEPPFA